VTRVPYASIVVQPIHHIFTFEDYLRVEEDSGLKHEFLDGRVWAMSGGTPAHAGIAANIMAALNVQLRGQRCRVFSSDLRIRVRTTELTTYPDVSVIGGQVELDADDRKGHTTTNPKVLVEVLSPSTERYDRGEKLTHYQRIATLEEIVLVAHDRREVEVVRRQADGAWTRHITTGDGVARLESVGCELALDEVYRDPLA